MTKHVLCSLVVMVVSSVAWANSSIVVLDENFESGLGAWTVKSNLGPNDDTPLIFDVNGEEPGGQTVFGPTTPPPAPSSAHSAGFSSAINPWDGSSPQWIERQWTLPPGTYDVTMEIDTYLYYGDMGDPWGCGDRIFLLTDNATDQYTKDPIDWGQQLDDSSAVGAGFRKTYWPGSPWPSGEEGDPDAATWAVNGVWQHFSKTTTITTTTGLFVLRLVMQEKEYGNPASVLWDNIQLDIQQTGVSVAGFPFTEGFESPDSLASWTPRSPYLLNSNDTPILFSSTDARLYTNSGNPGSQSVGFSSDSPTLDVTSAEWLQWHLGTPLDPGTYDVRVEFDRYVYKDSLDNPWAIGNRVYLLTDDEYDNPTWDFDGPLPPQGFRMDYWQGDNEGAFNGVWHHEVVDTTLTTATGNLELRLLLHDKTPGAQAAAWDNVKVLVTSPCNDPWADVNGDTFVDMQDFAELQTCLTIPTGSWTIPVECRCFNRPNILGDKDELIDNQDLVEFVKCATGPQVPWVKPDDCTNP